MGAVMQSGRTIATTRGAAETLTDPGQMPDPADVAAAFAPNTRRGYASGWKLWAGWCEANGLCQLPADPATVARYCRAMGDAGMKLSTIRHRLAAIAQVHRLAGQPLDRDAPVLTTALDALARKHGTAKKGRAPVGSLDLAAMLETLDRTTMKGMRDAALLLVGFAGAFRSAELVALDFGDIEWKGERGVVITVRRSKGDQHGEGRQVGIVAGRRKATDPVAALRAWLEAAAMGLPSLDGALFSGVRVDRGTRKQFATRKRLPAQYVWRLVKRTAEAAGLDPERLGSHSLRAGCATQYAESGGDLARLQQHMRHAKVDTTAGYIRRGAILRDSVSAKLGL